MTAWTVAKRQAILDAEYPTSGESKYIAYSEDGSSETSNLARTAIGATGWAAATSATPSVKANGTAITTAAASGDCTITHYAIASASTAGTLSTVWVALTASKSLASGETATWAIGALQHTL